MCAVLSGSSMILIGIFLRYFDLFLKFLFGTSLRCGLSGMYVLLGLMSMYSYLLLPSYVASVSVLRFDRPVWPMYVCGQLLHGIWYTTPALSSLGMGSLG